ncbi:hypothetical protein BDK89_0345 [Ilumatobacter fluminis]|uniref:Uncharacterized protein n=1 Tax=Ilumatobacter fluminis TaxID=467091 RepID=A0A4R7HWC0_9ACTN|nr:hypothetical protein BDK89_0345 [Ilumatobacter fluminis]
MAIDEVKGTLVDGDCEGGTDIELSQPVGDRRVVVDGELWERIDDNCQLAVYAPSYAGEEWSWGVPLPCNVVDDNVNG